MAERFIVVPGTDKKLFDGTVVILNRLPNLRWILHYGPYFYAGKKHTGWYFCSIPSDTTMPVFNEDLVNLQVIDQPDCPYPPGPFPPGPFPPGPCPPAPIPVPFTPQDKKQLSSAMLTVDTLFERDALSRYTLQDGKIVRVNDIDGQGTLEYYSWCAATGSWQEASLGYRYMTREEIEQSIGSDIVDIAWSNEEGALVITNHNNDKSKTELTGLAHDLVFDNEELTIRVPIYGKPDLVIKIPEDKHIVAIRFEPEWDFDGVIKPAIVVTVSDGKASEDIAGDATGLYNIYKGGETPTAKILINSASNQITAQVKLSSIPENAIGIDNEGLYVDLSGYVHKQNIDSNLVLVSDGNGGFTYGGPGVEIENATPISNLPNPDKTIVTANLVVQAIEAAIEAVVIDVEERLSSIEERINFGSGVDGDLLVTSGDKLSRSNAKIGGSELSEGSTESLVARETAVIEALSWRFV